MPFEDELSDAMQSTGRSFEPDLTHLVNAGVADGRKRRRRRTLGVLGGVTALAVVGIGGTVASGALGAGAVHKQAGPAAGGVPTHAPSAKPLPVFTDAQMAAAFRAVLPKSGTLSNLRASGISVSKKGPYSFVNGPTASVTFTDAKGSSAIGISVSRPAATVNDRQVQQYLICPGHAVRPDAVCTRTDLPDGSVLTVLQGLESPNGPGKEKDWTAWLGTKDGGLITLDETNAASEKGAVARPEPALTVHQLTAAVTDPRWARIASELPTPRTSTPNQPGALSSDRIATTLRALLPQQLTLTAAGPGQDGYYLGLLDDGHGGGTIGINADHFVGYGATRDQQGKVVPDPLAGATVLADGTKVLVTQGAEEKGGRNSVAWTVVVLHTDGRRVAITETNSVAVHTAADRPAPVLTIDQLKALALAPSWTSARW